MEKRYSSDLSDEEWKCSIRLTRRAVDALSAHKAAQNAERLKAGSLWEDHGLVFATHGGRPLDSHNVARTSFKPLLKRAGLPDIRFHDLRHTCATLLLSRSHLINTSLLPKEGL